MDQSNSRLDLHVPARPGANSAIRTIEDRALWLAREILPHEQALRAWLAGRLSGFDVDDLVQETYARLIAVESVAHVRNPRAYAFQTAHFVLLNIIRREKVIQFRAVSDWDLIEAFSDDPSPERHALDRDELRRLVEAIDGLPGKIQAVFRLRRVDGLSQREVALRLGLSESTVEKHMSRGLRLMAKMFSRDGGCQTV